LNPDFDFIELKYENNAYSDLYSSPDFAGSPFLLAYFFLQTKNGKLCDWRFPMQRRRMAAQNEYGNAS
jgi:hypothetical protein